MKHIFISLLFVTSCKTPRQELMDDAIKYEVTEGYGNDIFYVITIDECEYIVYNSLSKGGIIHKANCKNHP